MKKAIYLFLLILLSNSAFAGKRLIAMPFRIESDSLDKNLSKNESEFSFRIRNSEFQNPPFAIKMRSAVNGVWKEITLDSDGHFLFKVEEGEYEFQFYVNENFLEITSEKVKIAAQHRIRVQLNFIENYYRNNEIIVDKPVIYVHTAKSREFEIGVQPKEEFSFVYPEMNGTWKGTAQTDGSIAISDKSYPYLFWESKQQYVFHSEENGFKVNKKDVIPFLTKKLTELGLNQQEQTDFITYWGPKLAENESSFVQFSIDESCNAFAALSCSPSPDVVRRVYIQISKWDAQFEIYLKDVSFNSFQKSDWYLVEWGGFSFTLPSITFNEN